MGAQITFQKRNFLITLMMNKNSKRILFVSSLCYLASLTSAQNCQLVVPANLLTAAGLATPWVLKPDTANDVCTQTGPNAAFVEAVVLDTATGTPAVYRPVVINDGMTVMNPPAAPTLPAQNVIGVWVGFGGKKLTLVDATGGTSIKTANCAVVQGTLANAVPNGAFASCNHVAFFTQVNTLVAGKKLVAPALGNAMDGKPCPTSNDILAVDQNPSAGVVTNYLSVGAAIAPNTAANLQANPGSTLLFSANQNNENLLSNFLLPSIGCQAFTVNDLGNPGTQTSSAATNFIQAKAVQAAGTQSLVTKHAPIAVVNGATNLNNLNAYRAVVDQTPANTLNDPTALTMTVCANLGAQALPRLQAMSAAMATVPSPDPQTNMFNFMVTRMSNTWTALNCAGFNVANPTLNVKPIANNFGNTGTGTAAPNPTGTTTTGTTAPNPTGTAATGTAAPNPTGTTAVNPIGGNTNTGATVAPNPNGGTTNTVGNTNTGVLTATNAPTAPMDNATIIGLAVGISIAVIGLVGGFILFKRKNMGNSDFQQTLL
jgi:hypothetical protein